MKDKKIRTQVGIYNSDAGKNVVELFTKMRRRAERVLPREIAQPEPNLKELSESAMSSYRLGPEVVKTDHGFKVV